MKIDAWRRPKLKPVRHQETRFIARRFLASRKATIGTAVRYPPSGGRNLPVRIIERPRRRRAPRHYCSVVCFFAVAISREISKTASALA